MFNDSFNATMETIMSVQGRDGWVYLNTGPEGSKETVGYWFSQQMAGILGEELAHDLGRDLDSSLFLIGDHWLWILIGLFCLGVGAFLFFSKSYG